VLSSKISDKPFQTGIGLQIEFLTESGAIPVHGFGRNARNTGYLRAFQSHLYKYEQPDLIAGDFGEGRF
jgi:hypothetical protein